ncbi:MAG: glycosyltransferase family 39 protein [Anaerolineae bacterium]|nr:glycosyltransferase family 39 protein [Anaerolineae bacterium]
MTLKLTALKNFVSNNLSVQLALIAGASGLVYALVFTCRFPLINLYATIPPVDYTKLTDYSAGGLTAYLLGIGALFWLYLRAVQLVAPANGRSPAVGSRFVLLSSAVLVFISIFSYPLTAIDLFIYALHTRGWALYNLLPQTTPPQALPPSEPWLALAAEWGDNPSPYGPMWELLSLGAFYLSGGDFLGHLIALKIVAALAYLGCVWLVYQTLRQLQPKWAVTGAIAFGWSPLVLLESGQNGHNDIVMVFFLLAALWTWAKWATNRSREDQFILNSYLLLTCLFFALSILVKFVTIIIGPFLLIGIATTYAKWRQRWSALVVFATLTGGLVILAMVPFWPGLDNWAVLKTGSGAGRSLLALLVLSLRGWLGTNTAFDLTHNIILVVFALLYLYYLAKIIYLLLHNPQMTPSHRLPGSTHVYIPVAASFSVLFWYVLLVAPVFHAWYLLWFMPLAILLLPYRCPFVASTVFSITALLVIPYFETIRVWYPILLENHLWGHLIGVPFLIVPPAIAIFWPISPSENSEV